MEIQSSAIDGLPLIPDTDPQVVSGDPHESALTVDVSTRRGSLPKPKVWVFFYGSFINRQVLAKVDFVPDQVCVARLSGFDIRIQPLSNLVRSDQHCVYGIVCEATHDDLARLYSQSWVGTYLPEAVVVEIAGGRFLPALCYIAPAAVPAAEPKAAAGDYIDRIAGPAREYGFPDWYVDRLESFRNGPLPGPDHLGGGDGQINVPEA